tara:strand:+ start:363 stop:503 length:141 start_codon:yes stop_codon:yes gene_type:complete
VNYEIKLIISEVTYNVIFLETTLKKAEKLISKGQDKEIEKLYNSIL